MQINTSGTDQPVRTSTTLAYVSPVLTFSTNTEGVLACVRASSSATPAYYDGTRASIPITAVSLLISTTDAVILRVYRSFWRAGVQYGTLSLPGTTFQNPYPTLAGTTGPTPACMVEIAVNSANRDDILFTPDGSQLLGVTSSSSSQRLSFTNGTATLGVSLPNPANIIPGGVTGNPAPDVYVVTGQNITSGGGGQFAGVVFIEWSQET